MATNKMLIDASHPEETRVAVVRGNRVEEFDFESQEKRQLRGNIYLAKVTRVEPSLQAAFVDYGGNRHGFLAFSEIHPDYYQIPVADRIALLEAEAEDARASRKEDDDRDEASDTDNGDNGNNTDDAAEEGDSVEVIDAAPAEDGEAEAEPKKPKRNRRPRRRSRAKSSETSEDSDAVEASAETTDTAEAKDATDKDESADASNADAPSTDEAPAPSETKTVEAESAETEVVETASEDVVATKEVADTDTPAPEPENGEPGEDDASEGDPKIMSAIVEMDSISEPASEPDSEDDSSSDGEEEEPVAEKPKRRTTRRKRVTKKVEATEEKVETAKDSVTAESKESAPAEKDAAEEKSDVTEEVVAAEEAPAEKPKRRTTRRKRKAVEEKSDEVVAEEAPKAETAPVAEAEATPEPAADVEIVAEAETAETSSEETPTEASSEEEATEEPRKKRSRRSRRRGPKKAEASETESDSNGEDDVESVGQEDALEEVPVRRKSRRQYKIQEVIKRRQVLLVQVVKEERGNKGAALTTYLSLAGRYSVLMPNTARGGGISRKITNASDRKRLKSIANDLAVPEGMGVILRTAGATRTKAEITRDFDYLMRLWEKVRSLTLASSAPCLVYEEGSLVKRSIRDLYNKDINEILVSGEAGFQEAKDFMGMLMPDHVGNVKQYEDSQTIFSKFGVEAHLEQMVAPQVTLKSGGYLVINQTEALVAIDVNSGRSTREHSIEDTAYQTNLEAAEEVARQLRLRDLAGLIVIDFIDMEEKRNNRSVEKKMKDCLKNDRARIQVGRISHFGLMEMSRQRIRASVLESTMDVCPHCQGLGHIRSESAISLHVFRSIEEYLAKHSRFDVLVKTTPIIALNILNYKRQSLMELEERFGLKILIEGDMNIQGQDFTVEKGEPARGKPKKQSHIDVNSGAEPENTGGQNSGSGDEEDGEPRKRRRRRRGKGRPDENNAEQPETVSEDNAQPVQADNSTVETSEDADGEEKGQKRRRRRGKRGGKRGSAEETQTEENAVSADSETTDGEANTAQPDAAPETVVEAVESEESVAEKPNRRNNRRPRKAKSDKVETTDSSEEATATVSDNTVSDVEPVAEQAESQEAAPQEEASETEAASATGRNTRRPRNPVEATNSEPVVQSSGEKSEEGAEEPKKRGGWWSRAGGFFS